MTKYKRKVNEAMKGSKRPDGHEAEGPTKPRRRLKVKGKRDMLTILPSAHPEMSFALISLILIFEFPYVYL